MLSIAKLNFQNLTPRDRAKLTSAYLLDTEKQCRLGTMTYKQTATCERKLTCKAQPRVTASSAFSVVLSSLPKNLLIFSFTAGIRVAPPTISTA